MTRMTKIISTVTTALFALGLFSCSNFQDDNSVLVHFEAATTDGYAAYLTLSLDDASVSKTLLPGVRTAVFENFVLKGTRQGESQKTLGSWTSTVDMQSASVPLEVGSWTFDLRATSGGSSFSGTLQKEIVSGQNKLLFNLVLDDVGSGFGSFGLLLYFNTQNVSRVVASLENMDKTIVTGYEPKDLRIATNAVAFRGSQITAGTYRAKIKFYASDKGIDTEIASWSEVVQIASGFNSTAVRTIESFDELYTITYELNGGQFAAGTIIPEKFTRRSAAITLPEITNVVCDDPKYGGSYKAIGWYTDENCTAGNEITNIENVAQNITVYAKWPVLYTITYNLRGGSFASGYVPREKFIQGDVVELPEFENVLRDDSNYGGTYKAIGWYTDENCSAGNEITSVENITQNITVYAKWPPVYTITYNLKGGAFAIGYAPREKFIQSDMIELPDAENISRECYIFGGWYTDENCTEENKITSIKNKSGNINVYAKWTPVIYKITRWLGVYSSETTYTVDDDVTLDEPQDEGVSFVGWYEDESYAGNSVTGWNAGERHDDITLYADYTMSANMNVDENSIVRIISMMKSSGTITATGEFNKEDIKSVRDALIKLNKVRSDILVTLDMSNVSFVVTPYPGYDYDPIAIYNDAFSGCESLEAIVIPSNVECIGQHAFYKCSSLKSVNIPNTVKTIEDGAFSVCELLESINIPDSVTKIGQEAFFKCLSLKSVTIPGGVTKMGAWIFSDCSALEKVVLRNGLKTVPSLDGCSSLKDITIPDSVTFIAEGNFSNCTALETITISGNVNLIGLWAFEGCTQLKKAIFLDSTSVWYRVEQNSNRVDVGESVCLGRMSNPATNANLLRLNYNCRFYK